jgi:hypothetical protein
MHIDWATLAGVATVAAGAALTVVLLVAFALVGLSLRPAEHLDRPPGWGPSSRRTLGRAIAGLCLLTAGLIVSYGLYLIIT